MKGQQIYVTKPLTVELRDIEIDEHKLAPTQVLVRNRYTMISPGTELSIYTALDPATKAKEGWGSYPFRCGYISLGEVVAAGEAVRAFGPGDRVYYFGPHASLSTWDANGFIAKPPEDLADTIVPFTRMATIACTALRAAEFHGGDTVVVIGLGLVGNLAAQLFSIAGGRVIGVDVSRRRAERAKDCGVPIVVNPEEEDLRQRVHELTGGEGAEVVVEAIGKSELAAMASSLARRHGEVVLVGSPRADVEMNVTPMMRDIHLRGVTYKGALEWLFPTLETHGAKHSIMRNSRWVWRLIQQGQLRLDNLLTHVIKPAEFQSAYEGLLNKKEEYLGVLVDWRDG